MKNLQFALVLIGVFALIFIILYFFPPPGLLMKITAPVDFACGDKITFTNVPKFAKTLTFESVDSYKEGNLDPKTTVYKPRCSFSKDKNYKFILTALNDKGATISASQAIGLYSK